MPRLIPQHIYDCFSFGAGSRPDFATMQTYFVPQGLFINNKGEQPMVKPFAEFAAFINSNIDAGNIVAIDESEVENRVMLFGKVGQIASRYKLKAQTASGEQTRYGVNLFQIVLHGTEWKISAMCWDDYSDQRLFDINLA